MNKHTEQTFLRIPVTVPTVYFDGFFERANLAGTGEKLVWKSLRTGEGAVSDALYVIDRCASGLHFGIEHYVNGEWHSERPGATAAAYWALPGQRETSD